MSVEGEREGILLQLFLSLFPPSCENNTPDGQSRRGRPHSGSPTPPPRLRLSLAPLALGRSSRSLFCPRDECPRLKLLSLIRRRRRRRHVNASESLDEWKEGRTAKRRRKREIKGANEKVLFKHSGFSRAEHFPILAHPLRRILLLKSI